MEEKLNREEKFFVENPENACLFPADGKSNSIESNPGQGKEKGNTAKNQKEVGCRCFPMVHIIKFIGYLNKVSKCSLKLHSKLVLMSVSSSNGVNTDSLSFVNCFVPAGPIVTDHW